MRHHTANSTRQLELEPARLEPPASSRIEIRRSGDRLEVAAKGLPDHPVGAFPNRGNPHAILPQDLAFSVPMRPLASPQAVPVGLKPFGFALNGVFFDPGAAEFWRGDPEAGWQYEALGGAVPLGLDENFAHVQPTGLYHYHGISELLLKRLGARQGSHSPQVGWAADGFPVYARSGYANPRDPASEVVELRPSWKLKAGDRPSPPEGPGGLRDGAFVDDYEFVEGLGDLDECNGRFCVTPEFPDGTYAYFLTDDWPVIPRFFRGTPASLRETGPVGRRRKGMPKADARIGN